jgi:hypothetical protein
MKWIIFPANWNLGNIRAVLTVAINILCTAGLWIFGFTRWRYHAQKVNRDTSVRILDLLSIGNFGEAIDAIFMVEWKRDFSQNVATISHCLLVGFLTVIGVLAGPIARYITRTGTVIGQIEISGTLATSDNNGGRQDGYSAAQVKWNSTMERLMRADFPPNQLLDFLPDSKVDWTYVPDEWNSTWKITCSYTPQTPFKVVGTNRFTGDVIDEIPAARNILPEDIRIGLVNKTMRSVALPSGFYADPDTFKDLLMFWLAGTQPIIDTSLPHNVRRMDGNNGTMRLSIFAIHFRNIPRGGGEAFFGAGPADSAVFTQADCAISRSHPEKPVDEDHIAFMWTNNTDKIVTAYADYYQALITEQSIAETKLHHPSGQELVRFLQTYFITKDTQLNHLVRRPLSVKRTTVEIAALAVFAFGVYAVILLAALISALFFYQIQDNEFIARTKVEWIMQCVREASGRDLDAGKFKSSKSELKMDVRQAQYGPMRNDSGELHIGIKDKRSESATSAVLREDAAGGKHTVDYTESG